MADEEMTDLEIQLWSYQQDVDAKFKKMQLVITVNSAVGIGALALGFMAFKGLTNLAKGLQGLSEVTNGIGALVYGTPAQPNVARPPTGPRRNDGRIDETVVTTEDYEGPIGEPSYGPESEASERIKELLDSDPISPADVLRQDGLVINPIPEQEL